jgi:hypothetical protein
MPKQELSDAIALRFPLEVLGENEGIAEATTGRTIELGDRTGIALGIYLRR